MSRHRKRRRRSLYHLPGNGKATDPELLKQEELEVSVIAYGPDSIHEQKIASIDDFKPLIGKWPVLWINVIGFADAKKLSNLSSMFHLHELALGDVMHRHQRAKVDVYGDDLFVILHGVAIEQERLATEQLSIFLTKGVVITFEETKGAVKLDVLMERLRRGGGLLRTEPADYLVYAIVDCVIDGYFPVLEAFGDALDRVEDEALERPTRETPAHVHEIKRDVFSTRRAVWPARDAIGVLVREDTTPLLSAKTRVYMRDCYDHSMRAMDIVETQREMCSDLMDLYLSSVSMKMNEVIKVLTIVTLLFMPPTLVAGIYGMNFEFMPELKWKHGYEFSIALMIVSVVIVWLAVQKRGWLNHDVSSKPDVPAKPSVDQSVGAK